MRIKKRTVTLLLLSVGAFLGLSYLWATDSPRGSVSGNVLVSKERAWFDSEDMTYQPMQSLLRLQEQLANDKGEKNRITSVSADIQRYQRELPYVNSTYLPRALNISDHQEAMALMGTVQRAFAELNITWVMYYGTLLGSYLCHDILPWDDDLDILIEDTGLETIKELHGNGTLLEKYGLKYVCRQDLHKVFSVNNRREAYKKYNWSWPFVDLIPFKVEKYRIKNFDRNEKHVFDISLDYFLPLHMRPLGLLWLPSPRQPWHMLSRTYGKFRQVQCKTGTWNHLTETRRTASSTNCSNLIQDYAFAWRKPHSNGTLETLKIGEKALYSMYISETYIANANPFTWTFLKRRKKSIESP